MTTTNRSRRFWAVVIGAARIGVIVVLLTAAILVLGYRNAQAHVGETLTGFGRQLAAWNEAMPHSGARRLFLNGVEIEVLSLSYEQSLATTLDQFERECRRSGGFRPSQELLDELGIRPDVIFRKESAHEGVLACFDTGGPQTADEMLARIERFAESGDLNDVGKIRYVFARSRGQRTTVLALWTEGSLPLKEMFPPEGDAPGIDPQGIPRMKNGRRLLSAAEKQQPYSVTLYSIPESEKQPLQWYSETLSRSGWAVTPTNRKGVVQASLGGRVIFVRVHVQAKRIGIVELS